MIDEMDAADRVRRLDPVAPQTDERDEVKKLSALLGRSGAHCRLLGPLGEEIEFPASVFYVLERVVELMAEGNAVTIVPVGQKLTTQQAANILNVSRQYLVRLLESGRIRFEKTGTHRRIDIQDVLDYKQKRNAERGIALDNLTTLSEECGGYLELD